MCFGSTISGAANTWVCVVGQRMPHASCHGVGDENDRVVEVPRCTVSLQDAARACRNGVHAGARARRHYDDDRGAKVRGVDRMSPIRLDRPGTFHKRDTTSVLRAQPRRCGPTGMADMRELKRPVCAHVGPDTAAGQEETDDGPHHLAACCTRLTTTALRHSCWRQHLHIFALCSV